LLLPAALYGVARANGTDVGDLITLYFQGAPLSSGNPLPVTITGTLTLSPTVTSNDGGTAATGISQPSGGSGLSGWLSGIYSRLLSISGNVGGYGFFVSVTPTIQNASYVSGNCMGGFQAVAAARTSGGSGIVNKVTLISKGALVAAKQIFLFTANPSASTCTDKGAFTIAAADLPKLIATFSLTPAVPTGGAASEAEASSLGDQFVTSGNANIYAAIVETTTETPASTSDLVLNVGGTQN
jgi:hypothetical protein